MKKVKLHIDIETYSSIDIRSSGLFKYMDSPDFEILLICYAFDEGKIQTIDLARGDVLPEEFKKALMDPNVEKWAHNAAFERNAFRVIGFDVPVEQWRCTAIKSAYCGLPLGLEQISKTLKLEEKGKLSTGKALIKYFCVPTKPSKSNGNRMRNLPEHDPEKWQEFIKYCINDFQAKIKINRFLEPNARQKHEWELYCIDQKINDRGIKVDLNFAKNAYNIDQKHSADILQEMKEITGVENPNSPAQLKSWLTDATGKEVNTLAKDAVKDLIKETDGAVRDVLQLRLKASKTSIKKYVSMIACAPDDHRIRGLFQFYGANRTGRWSGRLVQMQNLPQNHLDDLDFARNLVSKNDYSALRLMYDNIPDVLSQLIRSAFIAPEGKTFAVSDFSAIEARIIAWLANEKWRMDVFSSHGKIYEASASAMFGVPIEQITKGSPLRQKGKVAELALGYQGSIGAMENMGAGKMGLSEEEMKEIVFKWRKSSPNIVKLWEDLERCALRSVQTKSKIISKFKALEFESSKDYLTIKLPSGRKLFYNAPIISQNKWGNPSIKYKGLEQKTGMWVYTDTYGGKLVENVVQAIARDLLAYSMRRLFDEKFDMVLHVHDEIVAEVCKDKAESELKRMEDIMGEPVPWAPGLLLTADGYVTEYYKKD